MLTHAQLYAWLILPAMIFAAKILDVSLQTLRVIFVSRGMRRLAPLVGFFEVLLWVIVIGQVMQNLRNAFCYVAYAGGFAAGTYVGMLLEHRLSLGVLIVRIITPRPAGELHRHLRQSRFGVTSIDAHGQMGPVNILMTIIPRQNLPQVRQAVKSFCPDAFCSIEDVRSVDHGVFPIRPTAYGRRRRNPLAAFRKGK
jgi:uncharacterized protein YebE (UPF0316 family)